MRLFVVAYLMEIQLTGGKNLRPKSLRQPAAIVSILTMSPQKSETLHRIGDFQSIYAAIPPTKLNNQRKSNTAEKRGKYPCKKRTNDLIMTNDEKDNKPRIIRVFYRNKNILLDIQNKRYTMIQRYNNTIVQ